MVCVHGYAPDAAAQVYMQFSSKLWLQMDVPEIQGASDFVQIISQWPRSASRAAFVEHIRSGLKNSRRVSTL